MAPNDLAQFTGVLFHVPTTNVHHPKDFPGSSGNVSSDKPLASYISN
jgi:hypothetical protein